MAAEDEAEEAARPRARFGRRQRVAASIALVILLFLLALWIERRPIAAHFVDDTLKRRGVRARYAIGDLGFGRQRLTDVVIGDPANPDLVADWVETHTAVGLHGATLRGVRAGHVRLRGRLVDGRLSLGALDRLLPAPSGKPFALPAIDLAVADARMRLATPQGAVVLSLGGAGPLHDGFDGRLGLASARLAQGACVAMGPDAALHLRTQGGAIRVTGPVRADRLDCGAVTVAAASAAVDLTVNQALSAVHGAMTIATGAVQGAGVRAGAIGGRIGVDGPFTALAGPVALTARQVAARGANAAQVALSGRYETGAVPQYAGDVAWQHARLPAAWLAAMPQGAAGTPIAPLLARATAAVRAAARDLSGTMRIGVARRDGGIAAATDRVAIRAASGATAAFGGGTIRWEGGVLGQGRIALSGGGLPAINVAFRRTRAGTPIAGVATMAPYAAGTARLALTPARFVAGGDTLYLTTRATLSGPLGDGHVKGLTLPLVVQRARGVTTVDPACAPVAVQRLVVSGLALDPARLTLCPLDGALVRLGPNGMGGGMRLAATHLTGRLGATPVDLVLGDATLTLRSQGFVMHGVETRIGDPARATRIAVGTLSGGLAAGAPAGQFADASGQIGTVPLLLSQAAGDWRVAAGALTLTGGLTISDALAAAPRFRPMGARDVTLHLAVNAIDAQAQLVEPTTGTPVSQVAIRHDLATGRGTADLTLTALAFREGFQPDLLTPLTLGVVAEVRGTVTGEGHIAWTPEGVISTGRFATAGTDLAAAFGPVTGIAGTITFSDLLGLETPPGQVATVKTINPGVPVNDGVIRYRLLPGTRVGLEGARWPFAGGTLTLDPTVLDFADRAERHLTFRVVGMDAAKFLQQFDFGNLDASGTFDGVLPMVFDATGGRIEHGDLSVRQGGGGIAYVGNLSQKDLGTWGNLAFQALKSLRYRSLTIGMNGPLAGEMITDVRFAGISQGTGAKSNFLIRRLQRLPFVFNVRIKAPFRGLLDSAQSFYDPKRLIERNLPALLRAQQDAAPAPVQPPASETVP